MVRKGQSALEYMMTYGWAILVIVIVAAVLYSLGIFSPSSSIGTGSTGFAPFTATASSCSGSGFKIAFTVGGTPGGASVTITSVTVTSSSGFSSGPTSLTASPTSGLNPSDTFVVTAGTATCTSGSHYSAGIMIDYNYQNGALGTVNANATGTVYGTGS